MAPSLPERTGPTPPFFWTADDARVAARLDEFTARQAELRRLEDSLR